MKSKLFSPPSEPKQQSPLGCAVTERSRFVNAQDVPQRSGGGGKSAVQQMTHKAKNGNHA